MRVVCCWKGNSVSEWFFLGGKGRASYGGARVLREVVGGQEGAGDAFVQTGPAVVGGVDDGVLESTGVLEVQVDLAVLAAVGGNGAGANVGLELIESISDDL